MEVHSNTSYSRASIEDNIQEKLLRGKSGTETTTFETCPNGGIRPKALARDLAIELSGHWRAADTYFGETVRRVRPKKIYSCLALPWTLRGSSFVTGRT